MWKTACKPHVTAAGVVLAKYLILRNKNAGVVIYVFGDQPSEQARGHVHSAISHQCKLLESNPPKESIGKRLLQAACHCGWLRACAMSRCAMSHSANGTERSAEEMTSEHRSWKTALRKELLEETPCKPHLIAAGFVPAGTLAHVCLQGRCCQAGTASVRKRQ